MSWVNTFARGLRLLELAQPPKLSKLSAKINTNTVIKNHDNFLHISFPF